MIKSLAALLFLFICSCSNKKHSNTNLIWVADSIKINKLYALASEIQYQNLDSAIITYNEIGYLIRKSNSDERMMEYYKSLSALYGIRLKNTDMSKKYLDSSWMLANKRGNEKLKYLAYFIQGRHQLYAENIQEACNSFLKSVEHQSNPPDSLILLVTYSDLAKIYFIQHSYNKSVDYYKPLLDYDERKKDTASMINNCLNYYVYLSHSSNADSSLKYLYKAKWLSENTQHKSLHDILLFNFSIYFAKKGNFDSALYYINNAIKEQDSKKVSFENHFKFFILKSQLHNEKKELKKANLALAESIKGIKLDQIEINDQSVYFSTLSLLRKSENKFQEALVALEKQNEIQNEIDQQTKNEQLLNHEKELKRLATKKLIEIKNAQISRQRFYSIILLGTCILICIIATLYYQHFKKIKKIENLKWEQKEKNKELENEKNIVRNQIEERNRISQEMHDDLGSTLTTISMAVELLNLHPKNDVPIQIINQSTNELSNKINEIVWSLNVQNDTLLSLIAYFRKFARSFLGDAGIKLNWQEKELIDHLTIQGFVRRAIFLSLKEILNNIVRHSKASEVFVTIEIEGHYLKITIKDNGVGLMDEKGNEQVIAGHGMNNIKKGISKLGGTTEYLMDHGTIVILNIPI